MHDLSNRSGLVLAAHHLCEEYGLFDKFRLSKPKFLKFFRKIQAARAFAKEAFA